MAGLPLEPEEEEEESLLPWMSVVGVGLGLLPPYLIWLLSPTTGTGRTPGFLRRGKMFIFNCFCLKLLPPS